MCGRYNFTARPEDVADHFRLLDTPNVRPRYNISPTQDVPVVALKQDGEQFGLAHLRWGLVPSSADDPKSIPLHINARSDSLHKPTFHFAFKHQRCLLPATGFYEWRKTGVGGEPVSFSLTGGGLMAFAGLWSKWTDGTRKVFSCCLITTEPNELMKDYHNRMPVILPPDLYQKWLDYETLEEELKAMLRPYPPEGMTARLANPIINKWQADGPECLAVPTTALAHN